MIEIALHCTCGGRLIITDAPKSMKREVEVLVTYFKNLHKKHGTAGVREPRRPLPEPPDKASMYLEERGVTG